MCIICVKPAGIKSPTKKTLEQCFLANPDGAGYMVADGIVKIKKGFLTFDDFWKNYKKDKNDAKTVVFHFRIATHGGISAEMTQPFPLSKKTKDMKRTSVCAPVGIAHNGIISLTSSEAKTVSDTAVFIKKYATLLLNNQKNKNRALKLIEEAISPSRMAVLYGDGTCARLGQWIEGKGLYFSNDSFRPPKIITSPKKTI